MKPLTYTAVDVETPTRANDSLCSIGVVHVENGLIVFKQEFLVNPEGDIDPFNTSIHGITEDMVYDAPTFPAVWEKIRPLFESSLLLAHNAVFDLSVIKKTLRRYDLDVPEMRYVCTAQLARKHIPRELFGSHRLNDLARGLSIPLTRHHNALYDAEACLGIFEHLVFAHGLMKSDIKIYK